MDHILSDTNLNPELPKKRVRVFAALIDLGLTLALAIFMMVNYGDRYVTEDGGTGYRLTGPLALVPLGFWFLIVPLLEGITGQTLGKMIFGISVANTEFEKVSLGQAIVRHLLDVVDWIPGFGLVGLLVASNNPNRQRVGDLVAKTIVIIKPRRDV